MIVAKARSVASAGSRTQFFALGTLPSMPLRTRVGIVVCSLAVAAAACSTADSQSPSTAPILTTTTSDPGALPQSSTTTTAAEPLPSTDPSTTTTTTVAPTTTTVPLADLTLTAVSVAEGFDNPVFLTADPDGGQDLVVEQPGRIVRAQDKTVVLDITEEVIFGGERGLLGLAFHPDFAGNRLAYVNYTGDGNATTIEQFEVGADGTFDEASRRVILTVPQPARNHNGGMIAFGPDGYLWIGMGDGGGANDRFRQAQRSDTLLGAMLRIAVGIDGVETYAIPPDNPFADGSGGAPEVFWTGLRNPWRFSFDGGDVWIADVGQDRIEEVNVAPAAEPGLNFGWPVTEGSECFQSSSCDTSSFVAPATEYSHAAGCSVTGGYVYRGSAIPELVGEYLFSDFCSGFLASYSAENGSIDWTASVGSLGNVSSFGIGGDGEVYVVTASGSISRIERTS